jgi:hypothetical protein
MVGMLSVIAANTPSGESLGETVSLFVPQGWAIRGMLQSMHGDPLSGLMLNLTVLLVWTAVFFVVGVLRFNKRYA